MLPPGLHKSSRTMQGSPLLSKYYAKLPVPQFASGIDVPSRRDMVKAEFCVLNGDGQYEEIDCGLTDGERDLAHAHRSEHYPTGNYRCCRRRKNL